MSAVPAGPAFLGMPRAVDTAHLQVRGLTAMEQVQEVGGDGLVVGLLVDATAMVAEVVPVEQHGAEAGHQPVTDVPRRRQGLGLLLRLQGAEDRGAGAQHESPARGR